ncbi:MAG: hypothetical protein AAGF89_12140, partial [Bacteroidota bacterium]
MRYLLLLLLVFMSVLVSAQTDSLLTGYLWEETSEGEKEGYVLRLNTYGPFEEDAGEKYRRKVRYLLGRWEVDSARTKLTLAVDYFMGEGLVHQRYRVGQDYYLDYRISQLDTTQLILVDELTGDTRSFLARPLGDTVDVGERRAEKIQLGIPKKGGL